MPALAVPVGIDALIVALLAAILIWASRPLWEPILRAMSQLPFVGAFIFGRLLVLADAAYAAGIDFARQAVAPLGQLVYNVAWGFYFYRDASVHVAESGFNAVNGIVRARLPQLEARLTDVIRLIFTQSLQYTQLLFTQSLQYTQLLVTQTQMLARLLFTQSLQYTQLLVTQTQMLARALALEQEAFARALHDQAIRYTQAAVEGALRLERELYGDLRRLLDAGLAAERAAAESLAAAALASALAALAAVGVRVLRLERSRCQQFCEPLGDLGEFLQGVEQAGLAALLVALAVEMAHDPRGTARTIDGLIGSEVRDLIGAGESAAGLRRVA